jgi:hypothetical protein
MDMQSSEPIEQDVLNHWQFWNSSEPVRLGAMGTLSYRAVSICSEMAVNFEFRAHSKPNKV